MRAPTEAEVLCASVPPGIRDRAVQLARNVLWMERKLEDARSDIADSPLAVEYDNGGGQTGTRKNPAIDAYNNLMASYTRALKQLCEMLGTQEVDADGDSDLDALISGAAKSR